MLARHEQAAGHAAEGYAVATGRCGVCIVTSGPAATNLVTAIADANMDSIPMIAITGQVGVNAIGTDAFQEADTVGITYPVTKHSYLVTSAQDVPRVVAEAYYIATTGRPGPVVIDLTKTAQTGEMYYTWPQRLVLPGYNPTTEAHGRMLENAAKLFTQSFRPVLYVGGGATRSHASKQIKELADLTGAPVVTTLNARGIIPDSDPKMLGMLGMHGTVAATGAVQRCDLLVALRRPRDRQALRVRTDRTRDPHRHRPCRNWQEPFRGRADCGRRGHSARCADPRNPQGAERIRHPRPQAVVGCAQQVPHQLSHEL